MTANPSQLFAEALQEFEKSRDVETFVSAVFADGAELARPETGQHTRGDVGARQFWRQYLDQFDDIHSEFARIVDAETGDGRIGLLEWTSTGHATTGDDISYRGVTVLDFDAGGRVTRFTTYYDTAPFTLPA